MIPLTGPVKVVSYDCNWPAMFEAESAVIKLILGSNCVDVHHVGSTSIPGMDAKPIIDIICVVNNLSKVDVDKFQSKKFTYLGEYGIPMRAFFIKRSGAAVNLHIHEFGSVEIELNLLFRDYLRENSQACSEYIALKKHLIDSGLVGVKEDGVSEYTLGKNEFIKKILLAAGFHKLRLMQCFHYAEWDEYHRIRNEQIFQPINVQYDKNHPTIKMDNHFHFVLYKGVNVVSVAHVEFLNDSELAIRSIATDSQHKGKGFGKALLGLLERWAQYHGRNVIKVHAALRAEGFYRKMGYEEMFFDDQSISTAVLDLGKRL